MTASLHRKTPKGQTPGTTLTESGWAFNSAELSSCPAGSTTQCFAGTPYNLVTTTSCAGSGLHQLRSLSTPSFISTFGRQLRKSQNRMQNSAMLLTRDSDFFASTIVWVDPLVSQSALHVDVRSFSLISLYGCSRYQLDRMHKASLCSTA